jgi:hypothetical protein
MALLFAPVVHPVMHLVDHTACSFLKGKWQDRMRERAEPGGKQLARISRQKRCSK